MVELRSSIYTDRQKKTSIGKTVSNSMLILGKFREFGDIPVVRSASYNSIPRQEISNKTALRRFLRRSNAFRRS